MKTLLCFLGTVLLIGVIAFFSLKPDTPDQKIKRDALKAIALVRSQPLHRIRATIRPNFVDLNQQDVVEHDTLFDFVAPDVIAHLEKMLDDPDVNTVTDVARTLGVIDPNNPLPLQKLVALLDTHPEDKTWIIHAIGRFGPRARDAVPRLLPYLKADDDMTLYYTAQTLSYIGPDSHIAVPDLIALLSHKDDGVIVHVAQCFGAIGEKSNDAVPTLIDRYASSKNGAKIAIIQALGRIRIKRELIVRFFDRILADTKADPSELSMTLYNLPQLGIEEDPVLENVVKLSHHRNPDVLRAANWVLERTKQPKAAVQ